MKQIIDFLRMCSAMTATSLAIMLVSQNAFADCPTLTTSGNTVYCNQSPTQNFVIALGLPGNFRWEKESGEDVWTVVDDGRSNSYPASSIIPNIRYRVVYLLDDGPNCSGTEYFQADVVSNPSTPAPTHGVICGPGGAQVSVSAVSGATYSWYYNSTLLHNGEDIGDPGSPTVIISNGSNVMTLESVSASIFGLSVVVSRTIAACNWSSGPIALEVIVHPIPSLSIGSNESACLNGSNVSLTATPSGGEWDDVSDGNGDGVQESSGIYQFAPSAAGGGTHVVKYSYTDGTTGCSAYATKQITVSPNISVPTQGACVASPVFELTGSPVGGTWSGSNVSADGFFYANAAGQGNHSVTYTVTSAGCTASKAGTVVVGSANPPAFPYDITNPYSCGGASVRINVVTGPNFDENISHYLWLDENNVVQRLSGAVIRTNFIDTPFLTSAKTYTVVAVGHDGCGSPKYGTATIVDITPPSIANVYNCADGEGLMSVNPVVSNVTYQWKDSNNTPIENGTTGGAVTYLLSGTGQSTLAISGVAGTENHTLHVRLTSTLISGCNSDYTPVTLVYRTPPVITFDSSIPAFVCSSTPSFSLTGASPAGGSWDVNNSPSSTFQSSSYSTGSQNIGYSYTDEYGCTNKNTRGISIVNPEPTADQTVAAEYDEAYTVQLPPSYSEIFKWYDSPSAGSLVTTGTSYQTTIPFTTQKKLYIATVRPDLPSCEGTIRGTITIDPLPPNNHNYVREEVMLIENVKTTLSIESLSNEEKSMVTSYIDGLGRSLQTVNWMVSPDQKDLVQPMEYDDIGREAKKYLPYVVDQTNSWLRRKAIKNENYTNSEQSQFYLNAPSTIASDLKPYALTVFESSPLNRASEVGAVGTAWQPGTTHTVKKEYLLNAENDILDFNYDVNTGNVSLTTPTPYYQPNTLFCNKTTDEHQNDVLEYVDTQGRVICKKVKAATAVYASTYYIYDDFGNLAVVLPPEAVKFIINEN
ncbi:MAG TPA: DUF6443 domain-containing protein [Cyclobacteriaceae bacterium]|nr:DUF6443 domain-containing protein [Cyclobacteriaceae bacterium]